MILIKPSYTILRFPMRPLENIEEVARTCYKSEDRIGPGTAEKMVRMLKKKKHHPMLEFGGDPTVRFVCDRGVSHELVRHRLCSFAQESTRYCNYSQDRFGSELTFVIPPWFADELSEGEYSYNGPSFMFNGEKIQPSPAAMLWLLSLAEAEDGYLRLSEGGQSPQEARAVLPNSLKTEIVIKANTREWMHIFAMRVPETAHPQMRELMVPLAKEFNERCPVLYEEWA